MIANFVRPEIDRPSDLRVEVLRDDPRPAPPVDTRDGAPTEEP